MDRGQEKEDEGDYRRNGDVYENKSSSDGSQVGCPKRVQATMRDGEGCEEAKLHSGRGDDPAMRRCGYPYVRKGVQREDLERSREATRPTTPDHAGDGELRAGRAGDQAEVVEPSTHPATNGTILARNKPCGSGVPAGADRQRTSKHNRAGYERKGRANNPPLVGYVEIISPIESAVLRFRMLPISQHQITLEGPPSKNGVSMVDACSAARREADQPHQPLNLHDRDESTHDARRDRDDRRREGEGG